MRPPKFLLNGYQITRATHSGTGLKTVTIQARERGQWSKKRFSWYVLREWIRPDAQGYSIQRCKSFFSAALRFALYVVEADYRTFRRRTKAAPPHSCPLCGTMSESLEGQRPAFVDYIKYDTRAQALLIFGFCPWTNFHRLAERNIQAA